MKLSRRLEMLAGIFLLAGLGITGGVIICFGVVPDLFKPGYEITLLLPDASGLARGSDVCMGGAQIGRETDNPHIVPGTDIAEVRLKIDRSIGLRRDTLFSVGGTGFASDKFVEVRPGKSNACDVKAPFLTNGEVVTGVATPSVESLAERAKPLIASAKDMAAQVDTMVSTLNQRVLTKDTLENLKAIRDEWKPLSREGKLTVENAEAISADVRSGHGALGLLLYDKGVHQNLAAFMANLREDGPLFYQDAAQARVHSGTTAGMTLRERYEGN